MVRLDSFSQLEEVFMAATIEVVDQVATRIPVILCTVKHLELDKGGLTCLHCGVILVSRISLLFWEMLNLSKSFHWICFFSEEGRNPIAEASILLFLNFSKL